MANENKNVKNLTLTEMKKQAKKLGKQTEHEVLVGENIYKFKVDDVFRKTKQYKLLDDLVEFFSVVNVRAELLELVTPYTTLLLIKHFTSIEVSDDIDEAIDTLDVLIDLELLNKILVLMPEQQVIEVYEVLSATLERMNENVRESLEESDKKEEVLEVESE